MAQASGPGRAQAAGVVALARHAMTTNNLKAVILRVMIDGRELVTEAMGESMTGVPATKDMHFRNGAVAISYISTVLLQLVDQGKVRLDDKLSKWSPGLPNSDRVSLRMLANMTAGYSDYVADEGFIEPSTPTLSDNSVQRNSSRSARPSRRCSSLVRTGTTHILTMSSSRRRWRRSPGSGWPHSCKRTLSFP